MTPHAPQFAFEKPVCPIARAQGAAVIGHSGTGIVRYHLLHLMGALFPISAGMLLFGWRAIIVVAGVMLGTVAGLLFWRQIGPRGHQLRYAPTLWLALLLSLMLPVHLASQSATGLVDSAWPLLPAAGLLLVVLYWLLGGLGAGRVHPVIIVYLVLVVFFGNWLVPQYVLQRNHLVVGDALNHAPARLSITGEEPWLHRPLIYRGDAFEIVPASESLSAYTTGQVSPDRAWISIESLLRDRMPPLEDLILGGHPAPIGSGSAVAVIVGGLFLLYRGLIDFRIPLLAVITALLALLILPVPIRITDKPDWMWMMARSPDVGWGMALTFANYEVLASPLLFTAFFLATSPSVRPMTRRGRVLFSVTLGFTSAFFQLYVSTSFGPFLALLAASMMTPTLDKFIRPRTLM